MTMIFDIHMRITEETHGIGTDTQVRLHVEQAPSGLYIASDPMDPAFIAAGPSPHNAILEYLNARLYRKTVEAEHAC